MKKGEIHWETLAKLIIMVVVIILVIVLIVAFRDRMYDIINTLRENF